MSSNSDVPTLEAKRLVFRLQILVGIQLFFSILRILFGQIFYSILAFLKVFMLYCSHHTLDPCTCFSFILISFITSFYYLKDLGLIIQNDKDIISDSDKTNFIHLTDLFDLVFQGISIYYVFLAYREFKALQIEERNRGLSDGGYSYENHNVNIENNEIENPNHLSNIQENLNNEEENRIRNQRGNILINNNNNNIQENFIEPREINLPNHEEINKSEIINKKNNIMTSNLEEKKENEIPIKNDENMKKFNPFSGRGVLVGSDRS